MITNRPLILPYSIPSPLLCSFRLGYSHGMCNSYSGSFIPINFKWYPFLTLTRAYITNCRYKEYSKKNTSSFTLNYLKNVIICCEIKKLNICQLKTDHEVKKKDSLFTFILKIIVADMCFTILQLQNMCRKPSPSESIIIRHNLNIYIYQKHHRS